MAPSKQRSRQLARAKWERQQQRRTRLATRRRRRNVAGGVIAGLLATGGLVWLAVSLATADDGIPTAPTSTFKTDLKTPSTPGATSPPTDAAPNGSPTLTTPSAAPSTGGAS